MRRDVFQAIADPTRREIIDLLSRQSLNLNAIAGHFEISRPAVSKHIRILKECGLLLVRREGRERHCRADLTQLRQVSEWTEQYQAFWSKKLDALGEFLEKERQTAKSKKSKSKK
ncbi:MAG: metalloregulator ArsR/SmtB family transcription factor [Bacteroidota bacterium]|nr:metalloregulator ArsR/SmtB family transcription factor [Bacteroidota bacterium]MDP4216484.1 metalloregulator ArsR/SmtB family transcription factor [Bacteroidota bacterium]MDP4246231.1 metalloregulator ArsR/SmtB family transcription factor [Bacteroidota bacterium]MDP4260609.1 metalloregulator ArsR/SmtB family transcription factor [Bacteroidota bacterium]